MYTTGLALNILGASLLLEVQERDFKGLLEVEFVGLLNGNE